MSRICAEYSEEDRALEAARKLVDEGVDPQEIEIRSPYPMAELAIPPHRSRKMIMRNVVRFMWAVGVTCGFSFLVYTQLWWGLKTDWQPIVSVPINAVITYECGMIVAIFTTTFMFFWETRHYRRLTPPLEEDLPVAYGHVVVIVDGEGASKAEEILKDSGHRKLATYITMLALLGMMTTGCGKYKTLDWNKHNMRDQQVIKPTEAAGDGQAAGTLPMPSQLQQVVLPYPPLGWVSSLDPADPKFKFSQPTPAERAIKNPVEATKVSLGNGKRLFDQNCAFCHGAGGQGDGKVGEVYSPKPANLATNPAIAGKTDGDFYHWIMVGKSTMPSFGNRLATVEIFDILNYLRYLQKGGKPEEIQPTIRKVEFAMAKPDITTASAAVMAPVAVHEGPPTEEPTPEAAPTEEPTPEATPTEEPTPAEPTASPEQIAAAGIPEAAADFPGVAAVATMKLEISPSLVEQGKDVYVNAGQCASCHGDEGLGNGPAGGSLQPPPRNLTAKGEYKYGTTDQALFRTIEYGVPGTGMAAQGEAGGGTLTEEQVKAVVAYVKSLMK